MENFWGTEVWSTFNLIAVLLASMLAGNMLKKAIRALQASLIPTSVIGGTLLIIVAAIYKACTGNIMFDTEFFGGNGTAALEVITYHCLALGFVASVFRTNKRKLTKQRTVEIFNTGVTTVSTYLLQAIFGIAISIIAAKIMSNFFSAAGVLLPFGYGQGTGQALNYGTIYETDFGFVGGKSFGLTIAALGFISAALGGVVHLNILRRRGKINVRTRTETGLMSHQIESENEIPMQESMDKMTVQIALVAVSYLLTYFLMKLL
ncbi:MAG: hypothetical protein J5865_08075, partial [Lachnospiraceae bacterium]|nr:hypothetical protein [Lachnospiraceae bacterium]